MNSPVMKSFGDARIAAGETHLVVDLGGCSGMDSTFMGTLAGLSARLTAQDGGALQIAEPGERNRRSLEDLGLDFLMEIDPPSAVWRGKVDAIRRELVPPDALNALRQVQRARHVLEAHQMLSAVNEKNAREFSEVVKTLGEDLADKEPPPERDSPG